MNFGQVRRILPGALLLLAMFALSGCLGSGGSLTNIPNDERALVNLKIRLGRLDVKTNPNPEILSKTSSIRVQKMIVTFTSNLRDTVHDTLASNRWAGFGTEDVIDQTVSMSVSLRALRWWRIDIETRDQNDSVIHKGTAGPLASRGGQSVELSVPLLDSRFVMYQAQYRLPREIWAATVNQNERVYQKIYFHRLVMTMDSVIKRDSTSFDPDISTVGTRFMYADSGRLRGADGKFFFRPYVSGTDTATHIQTYDYVPVGQHKFYILAYGYLEGDSIGGNDPRLLFRGTTQATIVKGGTLPPPDTLNMIWTGPGAVLEDTTGVGNPNRPDNKTGTVLQVIIGRTRSGSMTLVVDPTVPF